MDGTPVGPYVATKLLGRGGFGEVWKAWDPRLQRWVALKILRDDDDPEEVRRFEREAQTAAALSDPGIAAVYEAGRHEGRAFIAMQLIEGRPVAGPLPPRDAARIVRDAAHAVARAHERGVIHRDLKPSNVMLDGDGRVYVMDFGLARRLRAPSSLTQSGMLMGTPAYMSPEQARGERVDARSDIYSLGATLHELIAGAPPFRDADLLQLLSRVIADEPRPVDAPRDLATIVAKCLEKAPALRYSTAAALAGDLSCFLDGLPIAARPAGPMERLRRRIARRAGVLAISAAALMIAAAALAILLPRIRSAERTIAERDELAQLRRAIAVARGYFYIADVDIRSKLDEVERAVERLERVEPKDAETWTLIGMGRHFAGDPDGAERALLRAPGDPRAAYYLGRIYLEQALAASVYPEAPDRQRKRISEMTARAAECLSRPLDAADLEEVDREAAPVLRALAAGDNAAALRLSRDAQSRLGGLPGSEELLLLEALASRPFPAALLDRAIERRPHFAWAHFMRGVCSVGSRRDDLAVPDFDRALAIHPRFVEALTYRGAAKKGLGRLDDAIADYTAAIALAPGYAPAWASRGEARRERGDLAGAIADYTAAIERGMNDAVSFSNRGGARLTMGDRDGARADLDAALALDPDCAAACVNRGLLRRAMGDADGALADFESAMRCARTAEGQPWFERGSLRIARQDYEGALADLDEAIRRDPRAAFHGARAMTRLRLGDVDGALADCGESQRLKPGQWETWNTRGTALKKRGDLEGAIAAYGEAIRLHPSGPNAYFNRALARHAKGDVDGTIADLRATLDVAPPDWPQRAKVVELIEEAQRRKRQEPVGKITDLR